MTYIRSEEDLFLSPKKPTNPVRRPQYELDQLLRQVSASNMHGSIAFGDPVGREAW